MTTSDVLSTAERIALSCAWAAAMAANVLTPAQATEIADFSAPQQALYLGMQAATVIDWAQTRDISKRPGELAEANPILGQHPSIGKVNTFFVLRLIGQHYGAKALPDEYRTPVLVALNLAYASVAARNHSMEVKQDYGNDKAMHFIAGGAIGGMAAILAKSPAVGCLLGIGAGIAKEAYDERHGGKASKSDALATAAGSCIAAKVAGWTFGPSRVTYQQEF